MDEQKLNKLIDDIYEVPLAPAGWSAVIPMFEEQLRARVAFFLQRPTAVSTLAACGPSDPEMVRHYEDLFWEEDRGMQKLRSAPIGEIVLDSRLINDRERTRSRFYNDYLASIDSHRGLYASVLREGESTFVVSAQRSLKVGDYEPSETDLLRRLLPHLHRSFRTWQRLRHVEEERQAALDAMKHVSIGLALVDRRGVLHFANETAREQMQEGALALTNGRVMTRSDEGTEALHAAIRAAARPQRAVAERIIIPSEAGRPSSILVSPVRKSVEADLNSGPLAMLVIGGHDPASLEKNALGRAYGLTPAEARLLAALVEGERVGDYARRNGISVTTAKSHLRALFDKVGERRQADLIRRAVSDPLLRSRLPRLGTDQIALVA